VSWDADYGSDDDRASDAIMAQVKAIALDPRGLVRRRWLWISLSLVLGISGTAVMYLTLKPMYAAEATVLVSNQQIPEEFVRSTVSGLDSLSNINAMAGEILSYKSLSALIEDHDLYRKELETQELGDMIVEMRDNISVRPGQNVGGNRRRGAENASIFLIEYVSADPNAAAVVANELAAGFIDSSIRRRNQQARTTTEFMERELARAEAELRDVKAMITQFRQEHRGAMPMDQETILRKLERLETHRQGLNEQILGEEERLAQLRSEARGASGEGPEQRLAELKLQLVSLLATHTNEHPNVVALRRQIQQLEGELGNVKQIFAESALAHEHRVTVGMRNLESMRLELREVDIEMSELDVRAAAIPQNAEAFDALTQNSRVLEEKYLEFLRKVQDAKLAEELERSQQGPRVSILDHASPPSDPIRSSIRYLQLGIAVSIGLAILAALLAELIDPIVLDDEHLEFIGTGPVLGSIYTQKAG
jgi:uncharacterized protein involved in exopolysaccharide biosynthesis